jgi:hypothetical protein
MEDEAGNQGKKEGKSQAERTSGGKKAKDVDEVEGRRRKIQEGHGLGETEIWSEVKIEARNLRIGGETGSKRARGLKVDLEMCRGLEQEEDEAGSHGRKGRNPGNHEEKVGEKGGNLYDGNREVGEKKGNGSLESDDHVGKGERKPSL